MARLALDLVECQHGDGSRAGPPGGPTLLVVHVLRVAQPTQSTSSTDLLYWLEVTSSHGA